MSDLGNKEIFAKNLRHYIDLSGKTQIEVADLVGVAQSTFNDWVRAKKYPRIDKIEKLAGIFKIMKSDLIEEKNDAHKRMQKNNDIMSDIIVEMRTDEDLMYLFDSISKLDQEKRNVIKATVSAFLK